MLFLIDIRNLDAIGYGMINDYLPTAPPTAQFAACFLPMSRAKAGWARVFTAALQCSFLIINDTV